MAAITIAAGAALCGGFLYIISGRDRRYLFLLLYGLPLSTIVNLLVKRPIGEGIGRLAGVEPRLNLETPVWYAIFLFLLAPVFEEAIKVAPLLLPQVRSLVTGPQQALWTGLALGIGFGLGEAAYIAYGISLSPTFSTTPWYMFTGYLSERLIVTLGHGVLTGFFVYFTQKGGLHWLTGYVIAVLMHSMFNVGAILYQLGLVADWVASISLVVPFAVAIILFELLRQRAARSSPSPDDGAEEVVYFERT
jgi:uncharacterized membrane protein YhfC